MSTAFLLVQYLAAFQAFSLTALVFIFAVGEDSVPLTFNWLAANPSHAAGDYCPLLLTTDGRDRNFYAPRNPDLRVERAGTYLLRVNTIDNGGTPFHQRYIATSEIQA